MSRGKYMEIVETLRRELLTRQPGERFLSEQQVATRFKVSRPTASRALTELCHDGHVVRRVGSGTFVGAGESGTPQNPSRSIGLLLSGLGSTHVWDPLSVQIHRECSSTGISLRMGLPAPPQDDVAFTQQQALDLIRQKIDGVLFAPLENVAERERENRHICKMFEDAGIPVVLLDRDIVRFPARSEFDVVGVDNVRGGGLLAEHLLERSYQQPVFFSRPLHPTTTDQRVAGCAVTFLQGGVPIAGGWHVEGDPSDVDLLMAVIGEKSPDVIIASNDHTAALLIQTLTRLNLSVPEDLAVTGFDDTPYSALLAVPLTTVRQPFKSIAASAVRTLMDRINEPAGDTREILLPATLVVRGSTGRSRHVTSDARAAEADIPA